MITPEEKEQIIQEALERILKVLPETIGNLMKAQSMYKQLTENFYKENPELKGHSDIVREVVAKVEGSNPMADYSTSLLGTIKECTGRMQKIRNLPIGEQTK